MKFPTARRYARAPGGEARRGEKEVKPMYTARGIKEWQGASPRGLLDVKDDDRLVRDWVMTEDGMNGPSMCLASGELASSLGCLAGRACRHREGEGRQGPHRLWHAANCFRIDQHQHQPRSPEARLRQRSFQSHARTQLPHAPPSRSAQAPRV